MMAGRWWAGLGLSGAVLLGGCGGGDEAPGSGISMGKAGAGGAPGAAGSLSLGAFGGGGKGGGGGTTGGGGGGMNNGGAAGVQLHACPATPEPSCPAKVIDGPVTTNTAADWARLEGVTRVDGDLYLGSPIGIDGLSCLETVDGSLRLDFFAEEIPGSLWGLRNLRKVGQTIDIEPDEALYVDCGFSRLISVGEEYLTGGAIDVSGPLAGHLDLSSLKVGQHFRIEGSELSKVTLPSNTTLSRGQLGFQSNPQLSEIGGFAGIKFADDGFTVSGAYSLLITNNPLLSECRARELAQLLQGAGATADTMTIMGNRPCP